MKLRLILLMLVVALCAAQPVAAQSPTADQCNAAYNQKDYANALTLCRPLADRGSAKAQQQLGYLYANGLGAERDDAAAVAWSGKAADQGNAKAQAVLGAMYHEGRGVPRDYVKAQKWLNLAADQGNADAQGYLGFIYESGEGVPQDYVTAASWYRKAADQGNANAQVNLGLMYGRGQGVAQDYVQAHKWFNLAAMSGNAGAAKARDISADQMTPDQIAEAQKLANAFTARTATGEGTGDLTQSEAQIAILGAIGVTLFGAVIAGLVLRGIRGSWRGATSRSRHFAAYGAAIGSLFTASQLLQSILWQNEHDFAKFLVGLIVVTPVFAGGGWLLGGILGEKGSSKGASLSAQPPAAPPLKPLPPLAPIARHEPQPPTQPQPVRTAAPLASKEQPVADDAPEEDPYDVAGRELQTGDKHPGTWARAMVEADGDPTRTELAYVKLRVAALEAENAKRRVQSEADGQIAKASAARHATMVEKFQKNGASLEEAELRAAATLALASSNAAKTKNIPQVRALAEHLRVDADEAEQLLRWGIFKEGSGYRFEGKHYAWLAGALIAAKGKL